MSTYKWSEIAIEQMNPEVTRQVIHASSITVARLGIAKGGSVAMMQVTARTAMCAIGVGLPGGGEPLLSA